MAPATPLAGVRVATTADRRRAEQEQLFRHLGATVMSCPLLQCVPVEPSSEMREDIEGLLSHPPDAFIANTADGVRRWFTAAESWGLAEELAKAISTSTVMSRGPKAAAALAAFGVDAAFVEPTQSLSGLVERLQVDAKGQRIVFQSHGTDSSEVLEPLVRRGASVHTIALYRVVLSADDAVRQRLLRAIAARAVDAVTFTSPLAIEALASAARDRTSSDAVVDAFCSDVAAVCVGPATARSAEKAGFLNVVAPPAARLGAMVRAAGQRLAAAAQDVEVGGVQAQLRGDVLVVGGVEVALSASERTVLSLLLERPGTVVSKVDAMRALGQGDPHATEVAVARLRRRLDGLPLAIRTVRRRGYVVEA